MSEQLTVGNLTFTVRYSPHRKKSIGLTIERDGQLVLTAPHDCPWSEIERMAEQKQAWVYTKLAERDQLFLPDRSQTYVHGAGFYYLGRSYRLRLIDAPDPATPSLTLQRGRFNLRREALPQAEQHFIQWYISHGRPWLSERVARFTDRVGASPSGITVRTLGYRWGSCGRNGRLYFHWRTLCLPPRLIDYIIVHELVHLLEPHHGPAFWQRLARTMPDYAERQQWLAEEGGRY